MPSPGLRLIREWMYLPSWAVRTPLAIARSSNLLYREVCKRLRRRTGLTSFLSCLEGRVKALMCRRSSSGMVHHGVLSVIVCDPTAAFAGGVAGEYITQKGGPGAIAPRVTEIFISLGSSSNCRTESLAAASASSLPITLVWARTFLNVVVRPECSLSRIRLAILSMRT